MSRHGWKRERTRSDLADQDTRRPDENQRKERRHVPGGQGPRYIEGLDEIAAHGTRDMPMWGDLFRSLNRDTAQIPGAKR